MVEATQEEQKQVPAQSVWNTVTPLSKYLAMALFVLLPFGGFWLGYTYAPAQIVVIEKVIVKEVEVQVDPDEFPVEAGGVSTSTQEASASTGVVWGHVGMFAGNCMPGGPGQSGCSTQSTKATVLITQPSEVFEDELLVAKTETSSEGNFELELEPGDYSLFIYDNLPGWEDWNECGTHTACDSDGAYMCDVWACPDGNCVCKPFTIQRGERTQVNANIDHAAW